MLVFVVLGCSVFVIPTRARSQAISIKPDHRTILLNRKNTENSDNYREATVSFRPSDYEEIARQLPRNDRDLLYGSINFNGDRDWFQVALVNGDRSRIRDLGKLDWSDKIVVPILPILVCPPTEQCSQPLRVQVPPKGKKLHDENLNPHIAKPVVGHIYVVHTRDWEPDALFPKDLLNLVDFYTLVRVEELIPNERCTITWRRIPSPERKLETLKKN